MLLNKVRFFRNELHGILPAMFRHVFNTVATALAAMFIASVLGLPMPQIVMVTVVIVMQPLTRQVLDKGFYRLLGTVGGGLAAWALGMVSGGSPALFLLAVGVWVSALTFAASFSKQLKAYSIVLTGYTPVLIGVPAVFQLGHVGAHAFERLAEVGLGIACSSAMMLLNGARSPAPQPAQQPAAPASPPGAADGASAAQNSSRSAGPAGRKESPLLVAARVPVIDSAPLVRGLEARLRTRAALLAGLHPAAGMAAMAPLWLLSAWPGGAMATLNTTVNCALVGLAAQPVNAARQMNAGTLAAVAAALALQAAYPALHAVSAVAGVSIPHWVLVAPVLAIGACATGRPQTLLAGLGYSITLCMLSWPSAQPVQDAAGIALSVPALTIICAALNKFRPATTRA